MTRHAVPRASTLSPANFVPRDGVLDVVDDQRFTTIRLQNEIPLGTLMTNKPCFRMEGIEVFLRLGHIRVSALHPGKGHSFS